MLGLYIHIPFCSKICDYCDFSTIQGPEWLHGEYVALLTQEIDAFEKTYPQLLSKVETLYLGGGTPSLLSRDLLDKLFGILRKHGVPLENLRESTMEFNPESCDEDRLHVALDNGVTRISLGLQTFQQDLLNRIGRRHSVETGIGALERILGMNAFRVSADLMFNLPGQTTDGFLLDLARLVEYPLGHVSFYGLKVDPRTRLGRQVAKGLEFIDEDLYADMYRGGVEYLASQNFERYETSNFAKPGEESLHNLNYWFRGEYLGFGPGAHGFVENKRFFAPERYPEWRRYVKAGCDHSLLTIDPIGMEEKVAEIIQLSLRTKYGLQLSALKALGYEIDAGVIAKWVQRGYLSYVDETLCLQQDGWLFMDMVVEELYSSCRQCSKLE